MAGTHSGWTGGPFPFCYRTGHFTAGHTDFSWKLLYYFDAAPPGPGSPATRHLPHATPLPRATVHFRTRIGSGQVMGFRFSFTTTGNCSEPIQRAFPLTGRCVLAPRPRLPGRC